MALPMCANHKTYHTELQIWWAPGIQSEIPYIKPINEPSHPAALPYRIIKNPNGVASGTSLFARVAYDYDM